MSQTRQAPKPRTATPPAAPGRAPHRPAPAVRPAPVPAPVQAPVLAVPWSHRLMPPAVREMLAGIGWWQNPTTQPPSVHLAQVLEVLRRDGWTKSLDVAPTGRCCIRGAQTLLQRAGHVTENDRARAVHYLQQALREIGVDMPFFAWNDLPHTRFPDVEKRLTRAAHLARSNGE